MAATFPAALDVKIAAAPDVYQTGDKPVPLSPLIIISTYLHTGKCCCSRCRQRPCDTQLLPGGANPVVAPMLARDLPGLLFSFGSRG
jgi:hypothetical protein